MKIYTYTGFNGIWPVGTAAVIVAENAEQAKEILTNKLEMDGIPQEKELELDRFVEVDKKVPGAIILLDGDY